MSDESKTSMEKPEEGKQEQPTLPPIDPRLLTAMYGMRGDNDTDLLQYWRIIWKNRILIIAISLGVGILSAIYSLILPNIYQAEVLLSPVSNGSANGSSLGSVGGLASLAGFSLPSSPNLQENLAILQSREFIWHFIKDKKLMPLLFIDRWDAKKGTWKEGVKLPTQWDAYKAFKNRMQVTLDKDTGLVTLDMEGVDADQVAKWTNQFVAQLNEYLRQRAIAESNANLDYLKRELKRTQVEDVRQALFLLISQEQKKAMLANSRSQYAFRVLDAAVPPDMKFRPRRKLIVFVSTIVAGLLGVFGVYIREGMKNVETEA